MSLTLSFDIGYASIGWCVLSSSDKQADPEFLGTGVVTFPTDDCLASTRRNLRRTRRHIRSTRQRIERMKRWLVHQGVLSRADLDKPGHPAPFLLASAALQDHRTLTAWELWTVLRWYAHNRGYDGNSRWSREEANADDTAKEAAAKALMAEHKTQTMAETVCACLKLDPAKANKTISSHLPYKTLNAAYPRAIVQNEVLILLENHQGKIPGLDGKTLDLLFTPESLRDEDRALLKAADIKLPKRYHGGLLFGQLVPRFDNRIISRCPITWAKTYDEAITDGKPDPQARKLADKFAKVPAAKSKEFLAYRFARILANIKANGKPIDKELRQQLFSLAEKQGRLSHSDLEKAVKQHSGDVSTNLEAYFKLHPDSEEALVLDPVMDEVRKAEGSQARISPFWKHLTAETRQAIIDEWKTGKAVSLAWIADQAGETPALTKAFHEKFAALKPKKGEVRFASLNEYLQATRIGPKIPSGRAPYARPVLRQVVEEALNGWDATKANKLTDPENGENKPANGILYDLGIPGSRVRQLQNERPLDQLTNNHLVRHRMLILERLLDDLAEEFAISDAANPPSVFIEVARELKEFSGKDRQAIKSAEAAKLAQHKAAERRLKENGINPTYSLIRKCRIAMDLNWTCPFTHRPYGESELSELQFEHIIPRSKRLSDSMAGLVLTRPEINAMKGNRTARRFILDHADDNRIVSPEKYKKWVESLKVAKRDTYPDDYARQHARKRMLMIEQYEDKERTFTEGQLTQSSQLMKLAMGVIGRKLTQATINPIPGPVTAEIRKSWNLTGTLKLACPEIENTQGEIRLKDEIRNLTHLHHALDAATIALIAHYFPINRHGQNQTGKLWAAMRKRNRSAEEDAMLRSTKRYKSCQQESTNGRGNGGTRLELIDLEASVKNALSRSLAESRVMQHLPADRSGTKAELLTWGIVAIIGESALLIQRPNRGQLELDANSSQRRWKDKPPTNEALNLLKEHGHLVGAKERRLIERGVHKLTTEKLTRLLGPASPSDGGKLAAIRGALVIGDNFAIALMEASPILIPFHHVHQTLVSLTAANGGKHPPLIRIGTMIKVPSGTWKGTWRVISVMNSEAYGISVDLALPHAIKKAKGNAKIPQMLLDGLEILPRRYTGHPLTD